MKIKLTKGDVLLIVDVQNDFLPGGALPVPSGDIIVPVINRYIRKFVDLNLPVVASRDWHPQNHVSFKENGGIWPPHCVQGTKGAEFNKELELPDNVFVVSKATEQNKDAYSAFDGTSIPGYLQKKGARRIFVCGLATDYCVKATVLDALKAGFCTVFLRDASMPVNVNAGDGDAAISEMLSNGCILAAFSDIE